MRGSPGACGRATPRATGHGGRAGTISPTAMAFFAMNDGFPRRTTGEVVASAAHEDRRRGAGTGPPAAYFKMLTARAATSPIVSSDTSDCTPISSLARGVSGIASVGLKAVADVSDTNR